MDEKPEDKGGRKERVVYSRVRTAEERARAGEGASARARREPVAPLLLPLLVGFLLLVGLVYALGQLSVGQLARVGGLIEENEQRQAEQMQFVLTLRGAFAQLNNEARERGARERQGGVVNPFERKLRHARGTAREQLTFFERLPIAQTERGQAFIRAAQEYIRSTEDPEAYSLEGFKNFRAVEAQIDQIQADVNAQQDELRRRRLTLQEQARREIDRLTMLAVVVSFLIAAVTSWEVQRRFRQTRRSLEESRRERAFSSQMLEGMVSAVAAVDGRGQIRSANNLFFSLFPRAAVGASLYDDGAAPEAHRLLGAALSPSGERAAYRGRWPLGAGDGAEPRTFDVYSSPLSIDGEQGQILTLVDVTEVAKTEAELRRKDALAAVGQAAAQVAHEIKNPLGSIRLGVAMLRDMTQAREAHTTIDLVERGIEHLNRLTVDVTQYSREKPLTLSPVDLHELLDASLDLVAEKLREKETPVEKRYTDAPLAGRLDEDQLRQVFVNLFANAVDASEKGSPLIITTGRPEGSAPAGARAGDNGAPAAAPRARVTVTDRGAGMDERTRARIFEPFFTTKRKGTGLGLAIVKKIVEQHGGAITVESAPGEGTSFHVELPLGQARTDSPPGANGT